MRTRVRVIASFWVAIAIAAITATVVGKLPAWVQFWFVFAMLLIELVLFFALWRTQRHFRMAASWLTRGRWPSDATERGRRITA